MFQSLINGALILDSHKDRMVILEIHAEFTLNCPPVFKWVFKHNPILSRHLAVFSVRI